jgi:DNA-binding CsgD family transcriptional regulator
VTSAPSERAAALELARTGDVAGAVRILRPLADETDDPEDRLLLGRLAFVATDFPEAQGQLERAYRGFQTKSLPRRAALAATMLATLYFDGLGEQVVAQGWRARALRLLEHEEPCVEMGYALLGLTGASVPSAEELEVDAHTALDLAHRFHDRALECKALGDWGLSLVSMGRIDEGMARLDEAFTMIIGGDCRDPGVISQTVCSMLSACDRCGDVMRAETWIRFVERLALENQIAAVHTFSHCWSAFGSVLCQVGRWTEAETALRTALTRGASSFNSNKLQTRAALADLWTRQGRLDEAARLMDDVADRVEVMGPRARLYLAQGRYDLAAAVARRALLQLSGDRLRASSLLLIVVDAELSQGNVDAAEEAARQMLRLSEGAETVVLAAQAELALGTTALARGEQEHAAERFDAGIGALPGENWPLVRAALHLGLARARSNSSPAEAIVNAEAALSIYERVGAPEASVAAEVLRALGVSVTPAPAPPGALDVLSRREREVLDLLAEGSSNSEVAERLFISAKTAEHHVGSILRKLGFRNRAEAAAFAASFRITSGRSSPTRRWGV